MATRMPLALVLLVVFHAITAVNSQASSRVGAVGGNEEGQGGSSSPKQSSLVLPAVLQVMQALSEQVEDLRNVRKGTPKGGIAGHQIPPHLLRLMVLRNSLLTAAKRRKMSNFNGYSEDLMPLLVRSSEGTASEQLKILLRTMLDRKELTSVGEEAAVRELARTVLKDLEEKNSDLNKVMAPLDPVKYSVDL